MVTAPAGILFTLKDVAFTPKAPRMKQPFTIKGHIELFGITFYGPLWVIASVTYPQQWWDFVGSPVLHEMSMAIGGDFEIKYGTGFDREGEYSLIVRVYAGPTISVEAGPVKTMTLPPFPAAATYEAKFKISGEMPAEDKQYEAGQPSISPATVYEGSKVTISIPVTSKALAAESVVVSCAVTYGSILPGPGRTIRTYTSAPTQMSPGKTQTFSFEHTEVAPNDGKRDIVFEATVGGATKGYNHFDDAYSVKTMETVFIFSQPTINGQTFTKVTAGVPITVICPVVSKSSTSLTLKARIEIYQGSAWWTPGDLVEKIPIPQFTIAPNETANLKVTLNADSAVCPKDIRVFLLRLDDSEIAKSQIFANAYSVEKAAIAFTLGQPSANPYIAQPGQAVTITCPVTSRSTQSESVSIVIEVKQAGLWGYAGPVIDTKLLTATIAPGATYNAAVSHVGTTGGPTDAQGRYARHVGVKVLISGSTIVENEFDNVFYVSPGALPGQYTLALAKVPDLPEYSVTKSPDKASYNQGETVVLTALPADQFDHWEGDVTGTNPYTTAVMNANKSVIAVFKTAVPTTVSFMVYAAEPPYTFTKDWTLWYAPEGGEWMGDGQWHGIEDPIQFWNVPSRGYLAAYCQSIFGTISPQYTSQLLYAAAGARYEYAIVPGTVRRIS